MSSNHYFPHDHDEHGTREKVEGEAVARALHGNSFDNQVEVVQALAGDGNLAEDMGVGSLSFIKHCHKKMHMYLGLLLVRKNKLLKGKLNQKERVSLETYLEVVVNGRGGGGAGGHSFWLRF